MSTYSTITRMVLSIRGTERQRMLELQLRELDEQYTQLGTEQSQDWYLSSPSTPQANRAEHTAIAQALTANN